MPSTLSVGASHLLAIAGSTVLRAAVAACLGLVFFLLVLFAFHPYEGLVDAFRGVTRPEYYFALLVATTISVATLWRLMRGSTVRDEVKRAGNSIGPGES
jgi:hypothetical protein